MFASKAVRQEIAALKLEASSWRSETDRLTLEAERTAEKLHVLENLSAKWAEQFALQEQRLELMQARMARADELLSILQSAGGDKEGGRRLVDRVQTVEEADQAREEAVSRCLLAVQRVEKQLLLQREETERIATGLMERVATLLARA